jgi:hypothetical protein
MQRHQREPVLVNDYSHCEYHPLATLDDSDAIKANCWRARLVKRITGPAFVKNLHSRHRFPFQKTILLFKLKFDRQLSFVSTWGLHRASFLPFFPAYQDAVGNRIYDSIPVSLPSKIINLGDFWRHLANSTYIFGDTTELCGWSLHFKVSADRVVSVNLCRPKQTTKPVVKKCSCAAAIVLLSISEDHSIVPLQVVETASRVH